MAFDDDLGLSVLRARAGFLQRRAAGQPQPPIFPPANAAAPAPAVTPRATLQDRLKTSAKGLASNWWARLRKTYGGG